METNAALARAGDGKLWGRGLRHYLVAVLAQARRPVALRELVERVAEEPAQLTGRPSKVISDALRWEVARGRVHKTARGVYAFAAAPRSTLRFITGRVRRLRRLLQSAAARHLPSSRGTAPPCRPLAVSDP